MSKHKAEATKRWQEGHNCIKIEFHARRVGDPQLENSTTKEALTLLQRLQAPCLTSRPGHPAEGLGIPRDSNFEGQRDLIIELS